MRHSVWTADVFCALALWWSVGGCAPLSVAEAPPQAVAPNPVFIPVADPECAWERTVDVLHEYQFPIARENKLDGVIETDYKVGSGLLEPWHKDSVGAARKLESTLQSVRRRAFVTLSPAQGGYLVGVEVYQELEDLQGIAANSAGGATFQEYRPLRRDLNLVVGQTAPSGWIIQGRDTVLEQDMLVRLQRAFGR